MIQHKTLPRMLHYYERFESFGFWAAIEKSTGEFLGWFEFGPPEGGSPDEVELSYRLKKSAWAKGYATEGSRALTCKGYAKKGAGFNAILLAERSGTRELFFSEACPAIVELSS